MAKVIPDPDMYLASGPSAMRAVKAIVLFLLPFKLPKKVLQVFTKLKNRTSLVFSASVILSNGNRCPLKDKFELE